FVVCARPDVQLQRQDFSEQLVILLDRRQTLLLPRYQLPVVERIETPQTRIVQKVLEFRPLDQRFSHVGEFELNDRISSLRSLRHSDKQSVGESNRRLSDSFRKKFFTHVGEIQHGQSKTIQQKRCR